MAWASRVSNVDVRVLYAIVLILIAIPLIRPVNFPIVIGQGPREFHSYIESLPEGAVVVFEQDSEAGTFGDVKGGIVVVLNDLLTKQLKIVFATFVEDGPMLINIALKSVDQHLLAKKTYGEDYVVFGYLPGSETAISAFTTDMHKAYPTDSRGTLIEQIPMMKNIRSAKDVALTIVTMTRSGFVDIVMRQWAVTFNVPLLSIILSMLLPETVPYYPKYVKSILSGSNGAAQYEALIKKVGDATAYRDSLALGFLFSFVLTIVMNIAYFASRAQRNKMKGNK